MSDSVPNPAKSTHWRARVFWLLLWIVGIFGIGVLVNYSRTFTDCVHTHKNDSEYRQLRERVGLFPGPVERTQTRARLLYACVGDFADKNSAAIVAFATLIVGLFTFTLWRSTDRLWRASLEHANHADRAIKVSRDAAQRELRAYISVQVADYGTFSTAAVFGIKYVVINSGHTPASRISISRGLDILPHPPPSGYVLPDPTDRQGEFITWPQSRSVGGISLKRAFTGAELADVRTVDGPRRVYFWGRLDYKDAFGEDRFSEFCFSFDPASVQVDANGKESATWAAVAGYNNFS